MPLWKVRANATSFAHLGVPQKPGAIVELPRRIAAEFPHLLDECNAQGELLTTPTPPWAAALEGLPAHENVDVLEHERDTLVAQIDELRGIAEERTDASTTADAALAAAQASLRLLDQRITDEIAAARQLLDRRLKEEAAAAKKAEKKTAPEDGGKKDEAAAPK
jgi:hypothetical protein